MLSVSVRLTEQYAIGLPYSRQLPLPLPRDSLVVPRPFPFIPSFARARRKIEIRESMGRITPSRLGIIYPTVTASLPSHLRCCAFHEAIIKKLACRFRIAVIALALLAEEENPR